MEENNYITINRDCGYYVFRFYRYGFLYHKMNYLWYSKKEAKKCFNESLRQKGYINKRVNRVYDFTKQSQF